MEKILKGFGLKIKLYKSDFNPKTFFYKFSNGSKVYFSNLQDESDEKIYEIHRNIWSENSSEIFFVFGKSRIYLCDSKTRPNPSDSKLVKIKDFSYGKNNEDILEWLNNKNFKRGEIWDKIYAISQSRKKQRKTVDNDLLENLNKLKKRIIEGGVSRENALKIIDRCLFIRFLEDRAGIKTLTEILEEKDGAKLKNLFNEYNNRLNGDIFKGEILSNISTKTVEFLKDVFGEYYTYKTGQKVLFPYSFDKISIILISNIYEKFLCPEERNNKGIVYTPENLVELIIDKLFQDKKNIEKIKEGNFKILDPSCGSGIFLVKFLEKYLNFIDPNQDLTPLKISKIIKRSFYGFDLDENALRIVALSLYLKIFERIKRNDVRKILEDKSDNRFMFPGLRKENLFLRNTLLDEYNMKFDFILGNPPWGFKFSNSDKKQIQKKYPYVSDYQSSQCFMLKVKDLMEKDAQVSLIVNFSNFQNKNAEGFYKEFLKNFSINSFVNLIDVKDITFGSNSEPSAIISYNFEKRDSFSFFRPQLSPISKLTNQVLLNAEIKIKNDELTKYNLWNPILNGYYNDFTKSIFNSFLEETDSFKKYLFNSSVGIMLYLKEKHEKKYISKDNYESLFLSSRYKEGWRPLVKGTNGLQSHTLPSHIFMSPNIPLDRDRNNIRNLFAGKKLIISRSATPKVFVDEETRWYDGSYIILKLKEDYKNLYTFFEYLFSSDIALLYFLTFSAKRLGGNFSKVDKIDVLNFPIPLLDNLTLKKIAALENAKEIDEFIYRIYGVNNYRDKQMIKDFIENTLKPNKIVDNSILKEYAQEFKESFKSLVQENYFMNFIFKKNELSGVIAEVEISPENKGILIHNYKYGDLFEKMIIKNFLDIPEDKIFRFYSKKKLFLLKPVLATYWRKSMALNDVDIELNYIFNELR